MNEIPVYTFNGNIRPFSTQNTLKEHLQRYVRAVFAETLRGNGFASFQGEDLCWYKVVNHEVLHSVYFYTRHRYIPIFPQMSYGIHPLFQEVSIPIKAYTRDPYAEKGDELMRELLLGLPNGVYNENTLVNCPDGDGRGLKYLQNILPEFAQSTDLQSTYLLHKKFYESTRFDPNEPCWELMSLAFIEEVIYQGDSQVYSICLEEIDKKLRSFENPTTKWELDFVRNCTDYRRAILEDRAAYLAVLEERKRKFVKKLQKAGIEV